VDRIKTQTLHVTTDQIFSTLLLYGLVLCQPVQQFGRTFQVYGQADSQFAGPRDIEN